MLLEERAMPETLLELLGIDVNGMRGETAARSFRLIRVD